MWTRQLGSFIFFHGKNKKPKESKKEKEAMSRGFTRGGCVFSITSPKQ